MTLGMISMAWDMNVLAFVTIMPNWSRFDTIYTRKVEDVMLISKIANQQIDSTEKYLDDTRVNSKYIGMPQTENNVKNIQNDDSLIIITRYPLKI